ncbi:MAG: hypothetical protein GC191_05890 [Azospirillum sp.]|nr:hypothetical protein [Azospirillum sp.]
MKWLLPGGSYVSRLVPSGKVTGLGDTGTVHLVEGRDQKVARMLDALFDPADRSVISIREAYVQITGDSRFTGNVRSCDQGLLRESLGSQSFADVLGDSISRMMIRDYNTTGIYDVWRDLVRIVPVSDFRTQERVRFGGYGDLPGVAEGEPYMSLDSPTDEKATYAATKRGGTEDITLEMITNDDVGVVVDVPRKLARAAKRTLSKSVLDFLTNNPVIYDGVALFHADHGNLGTAALSSTSVGVGRKAMRSQTEKDSGERLGIGPRFLWVPDELEETAFNLFRRSTNLDADFVQSLQLAVRPVWCWSDTNDWCLSADTNDVPVIEVGFLKGQQEPELFVQDSPTSGSLFSNDIITYKIRHIYGGAVIDFRGLYKGAVP